VEMRLEPEHRGDPTIEGENEVRPNFHPNDFVAGDPGICAATRRDGANFPNFVIPRRFSN